MPTVLRFAGLRIVISPADHRPAHVHVMGAGREAVFKRRCPDGPPELRESFGFGQRELTVVEARLHRALPALCDEWRKRHGDHG